MFDISGIESTQSGLPFNSIREKVQTELIRILDSDQNIFLFLVGIPGSGKTTFTHMFLDQHPCISYDILVAHLLRDRTDPEDYIKDSSLAIVNQMEHKLRERLQSEDPVVVFEEATIGLSKFRAHFLYLARLHGYRTVLVHFPIDKETAIERNLHRGLGMNQEGQMRMPQIILDTIHQHQDTDFSVSSTGTVKHATVSEVPFLTTQLTEAEQAVVNAAFFRFTTLGPGNSSLRQFLQEQDMSDEYWVVRDQTVDFLIP